MDPETIDLLTRIKREIDRQELAELGYPPDNEVVKMAGDCMDNADHLPIGMHIEREDPLLGIVEYL